ncbi:hypothetical protein BU26DRAFT_508002 [Trematosphaeria pertusa]|uniref:Uncharacterized protein n=1 Tax=Trematosphaeria pertusa TaxID=390896 RepID=A0A6A6I513_9PLEO|nr:uncharacterized protein BU26DRAFT_508002 [Trematosphaeria pertusa]KAF2245319.1 hypothetical protein BU26DRAFT_508002 [Trematosphaeria pertusa]
MSDLLYGRFPTPAAVAENVEQSSEHNMPPRLVQELDDYEQLASDPVTPLLGGGVGPRHVVDEVPQDVMESIMQELIAEGHLEPENNQPTEVHTQPPTAYPTEPVQQAPTFSVEAAAPQDDAHILFAQIPAYDYTFHDALPINFTAVEIIVFLPKWFHNRWIARRLCNNKMTNPIHHEILKTHCFFDERWDGGGVSRGGIANAYLDAMRGHDWRNLSKDEQKDLWNRKNHRTPAEWDNRDISINGFVPDRIRERSRHQQPPSVPFRELLKAVKKVPEGDDTADLTRAVQWAVVNEYVDEHGRKAEYLFPDHLSWILNNIGRTQVTNQQLDGAIVRRYDSVVRAKADAARIEAHRAAEASTVPSPSPAPPRLLGLRHGVLPSQYPLIPDSPDEQHRPLPPQYPQIPEVPDTQHTSQSPQPAFAQAMQPSIVQQAPVTFSNFQAPGQVDMWYSSPLPAFPELPPMPLSLIRNEPVPALNDVSDLATVIRFSQRPEQLHNDWCWDINHLDAIEQILKQEQAEFEQRFNLHPIPLEFRGWQHPIDTSVEVERHPPLTWDEMREYTPQQLLRECREADDLEDGGEFARAARFAGQPDQVDTDWYVGNIPLIMDLEWVGKVMGHEYVHR